MKLEKLFAIALMSMMFSCEQPEGEASEATEADVEDTSAVAEAPVRPERIASPRPSPLSSVSQAVGLTDVEVVYSRPGKKGRKIFGGLVEYDKIWRTGANAATKISFEDTLYFEGKPVAPAAIPSTLFPERISGQ